MRFFFSSRRRHTRYIGDWSSDVCSSDLRPVDAADRSRRTAGRRRGGAPADAASRRADADRRRGAPVRLRSEERRVGKEGRARGWAEQDKKKRKSREVKD